MGVHDDAKYLPYSLRCLSSFEGEIIFVLDKPTKKSVEVVKNFSKNKTNVKILVKGKLPFKVDSVEWRTYLFGTFNSHGDRIFLIAPDFVFSQKLFDDEHPLPCKFQYIDYPNHFMFAFFKFLSKFTKHYTLHTFPKTLSLQNFAWRQKT